MRERFFHDDGSIIHQRTFDVEPAIERARALRDAPTLPMSDSRLVASVPMPVIAMWLKEAGVKWDDPAAQDVVKRKLLSGEASKFRVDERTY